MTVQKTILIVEDDTDIRNSLDWLLSLEGYSTLSATNGQDAVDRLQDSKADLILLDLMMPMMNGVEFLSRLRGGTLPIAARTPVIILSAAGDVFTSELKGKETFLKKPVDSDKLLETIASALSYAKIVE